MGALLLYVKSIRQDKKEMGLTGSEHRSELLRASEGLEATTSEAIIGSDWKKNRLHSETIL